MDVPEVLEVLDGPDFEVQGGVLVADHQRPGVLLKGRHSPHVVHTLLDSLEGKDQAQNHRHQRGIK